MEVPRGAVRRFSWPGRCVIDPRGISLFVTMIPACGDAGRTEIAMLARKLLPAAALCLPALFFPLPSFAQASPESPENSTPPVASETLEVVVVSANRIQENKNEISSNVTIIDSEDIKASTATSVADLMVQHGFHVVTMGDTSNVQIRGMGNLSMANEVTNQVLILLNGRRIGMSNLALAGLANVERVEIVRGPSAVQYGSSAMGGIVNIVTRRGEADKPFASVEVGIGSDSLKRQTIAFGGAVNGFDLSFGGTHYSRDDITTEGGRRWYHTAVDKNLTYNLDLGYTFYKNHRIGINHYEAETQSELMSSSGGGIRPYSGNTPSAPYTDYLKRNKNTAFSYTGSEKNLNWTLSYSFGKNDQKDTDPATGLSSYKNALDIKAFNAQVNYRASRFTLSGGVDQYQYDLSGFSSWTGDDPKGTMRDTGAYLTGKLHLLDDQLTFSLGLRHDKFKNSGTVMDTQKDTHTGGSMGVSYLPVKWLKLRANYANGFRMPSPYQIGGDNSWYIANTSLKPERNKTWELGADIDWNNLNASLTYFHSDWREKIIGVSVPGWVYQYQNLKKAEIAGFEGSAGWDLGKAFQQGYSLRPYVGFTWLTTRKNKDPSQFIAYHGAGNTTLPNTPKWMASYGIDFAHPGWKLKSRLNANYYGKTLTQDWSGTVSLPPGDSYFARPSGTVVNWSLEKELADFGRQFGKLTLRTEVNNLFDNANEIYWNYPEQGRNFYIGLRYDFN
ncbi:MAG: TonB-dependent receptor [Betaproteobacteria bacterium]|nr:TonB-dependent receptor [Betaproteobacteria bacterium]